MAEGEHKVLSFDTGDDGDLPDWESVELHFGKHKGSLLPEVPNSYLEWCLDECDLVRDDPDLYDAIKTRLTLGEFVPDERRGSWGRGGKPWE